MKLQTKRLFINNLPDNITQSDLEQKFANYGTVASVEIKQRKNIRENQAAQFAYVQLDVQTNTLYDCINEFSNKKWKGHWVEVQEAKESFMDRLKREREQLQVNEPVESVPIISSDVNTAIRTNSTVNTKKYHSSSSESSSDDEQDSGFTSGGKQEKPKQNGTLKSDDYLDGLVIKSNKGKQIKGGLKIESVAPMKNPVSVVENENKKLGAKEAEADKKRLQSIMQMKKGYQQQKSLIKSSLLNIDSKPKNKIVFDDDGDQIKRPTKKARFEEREKSKAKHKSSNKQDKLTLFEDEENEDNNEQYNFEVKEHLEGKKGQKLMHLQSRFKNDKRFEMDAKFLEGSGEESENDEEVANDKDHDIDISQEEEKQKQFEILEEVLGKKVSRRTTDNEATESKRPKMMLRFDPSQPEHSKYELKEPPKPEKGKRKRKDLEKESETKPVEEEPKPEVSKDTFYKVAVDLKDALHEKEGFSLASMFSKEIPEEEEQDQEEMGKKSKTALKQKMLSHEANPFKYDSSSDDDDEGDNEKTNEEKTNEKSAVADNVKQSYTNPLERVRPTRLWTESFFFKDDDYRLQEGIDFVQRLAGNDEGDFSQLRRNLKVIVKAKVKNNQRKNRPFKRKLGGKKRIRVKRAMKR